MKKTYEKPEVDVIKFDQDDIVAVNMSSDEPPEEELEIVDSPPIHFYY